MKPVGHGTAGQSIHNFHGAVYNPCNQVGGGTEGGSCCKKAEQHPSLLLAVEINWKDSQYKKEKETDS